MTASELRKKYKDFFVSKGHAVIPSASLVPENDPSVLFTTAGMHPLVPFLLGEKHPAGKRLVDVQKCVRTGDIDEVGNSSHHTFFEMLGNWSLGDYFKEDAIKWSYEFLTSPEWLGLDKNKLAVSVFQGDEDAPFDEEAFEIWKSLGIPEKRIAKLPKKNNWWGMESGTGPCGPDSEMFYWTGDPKEVPESFNDDDPLWVEIWNDVFMQFNRFSDGKLELLGQKNVDTGMGLERTLAVVNGLDDNYKTDLFGPIIKKLENISSKKYEDSEKEFRIIADHLRAAVFIIGDGIKPSNTDRGYVLRRLIRRAIRYANIIGIANNSLGGELTDSIIEIYKDEYKNLIEQKEIIKKEISDEEEKFRKTLQQGLKEVRKRFEYIRTLGKVVTNPINGKECFDLFQTYGFPLEMIFEEIENFAVILKFKLNIDKKKITNEFRDEFKKHQDLSRTASAGMFKGGLADTSIETTRLHTAAHLMLEALRRAMGDHIQQKGSNITPERLRFDFSHGEKVTPDQITQVESIVNEQIDKKLPVHFEEMSVDDAKKVGATGVFEHKYGDKVKVYFIGNDGEYFSKEICGGPHVSNTSELGKFKIIKEESASAGIRRIKAILE